jgi:3-oxoacyl-[acyl-carrier protein] reductase
MTKALAKELGPSKITVNCIAPGVIDTDMNKSLSDSDRNALIDETPVCRLGTARDVSRVAHFLCEDASDFITGQVLSVDGGFII